MREGGGVGSYPLDWCVYARGWSFYWREREWTEVCKFCSFLAVSECTLVAILGLFNSSCADLWTVLSFVPCLTLYIFLYASDAELPLTYS